MLPKLKNFSCVYGVRLSSESWQSDSGNRTSRRCFFSRRVSIISSVGEAASGALLPNPTWAEARPICQAWSHPETNCSASPLWSPMRQPATGGQQRCYWFLMQHRKKEVEREKIRHINLCRWCLWPDIALQLCTAEQWQLQRDDKQQRKKKKSENKHFSFFLLSSLRASVFNKSPTLFLISSLCFTNLMTAVGPFPSR